MSRPVAVRACALLAAALSLLVLLAAGCGERAPIPNESLAEAADDTPLEHAAKHLDTKYVCPMHPQIVRDEPGTCPICGMTLVQRRVETEKGERPEVSISPAIVQTMGVRTARAERGTLWRYVRTVGRIEYDETRLAHVHPRAEGWIETLLVRSEGAPVSKGQTLAELYAPEILSAQVDFLLAMEPQPKGVAQIKAENARNLLRLLDVPEPIIREIEQSRRTRATIPVLAPIDGILTGMMAREGMYVDKATDMFTVADLSRVWVMVDVFEHQIAWIEPGAKAEIQVPAYPGRTWEGKVEYLYPDLDSKTRTLRVRLAFPNPDLDLKPNMFADATIYGGPKRDLVKIPREALILTGERESVVKALGDGRFRPVNVVAGIHVGDEIEILSGLAEGDSVVVSGQFLIDSEASLRASFARMSGAGDASGGDGHDGH
jgi:Cu(I)/Ag(I) efflux system membrane fusion protein